MPTIRAILFADYRPGHYHVSEGVIEALGRIADVKCTRIDIRRRRLVPNRILRELLKRGVNSERLIQLGYGLNRRDLGEADLIVSSGGETLITNVAAADILGADNIFCGTLRTIPPEAFSLVLTSYDRLADEPRHTIVLKPNTMDPDSLGRSGDLPKFSVEHPPQLAGCLIGGDSGFFKFREDEWQALADKLKAITQSFGTKWLISTSRRSGDFAGDIFKELARDEGVVQEFVDYRTAGPGTLPDILARADVILCTADSSSMVSEAVSARQPVIGIMPATFGYKSDEAEYLEFMKARNWCRFLDLKDLDPDSFMANLSGIEPMSHNHLDVLADVLRKKLPNLFDHESTGPT